MLGNGAITHQKTANVKKGDTTQYGIA